MKTWSTDILIIGAGFAGSLMALCLRKLGRDVMVVDRDRHPRFAIGESSTPLADLMIRQIAEEFHLPQLVPLSAYGSWKTTLPELGCGLKRGFSYFHHR
ncbi:MAG: FAD-dependent oxidoreductase, partial [Planctomycetaceae bacterium]|nr:FAD-dependent oxidoreductase [Planctomycetaceae bacterium]